MGQTKFNLPHLNDLYMNLDDNSLYVTSFEFNRDNGYDFKVSSNREQECIRFDFAELQDILDDWVSEIVVMNDHVIFVSDNNIFREVDEYNTDDDGEFNIVKANDDIYLLYPKNPKVHKFSATSLATAKLAAQDALMKLVGFVGKGFHPETLAEDYAPGFTPEECVYINATLTRINFHLSEKEMYGVMNTTKEFKGFLDK